MIRHVTPANRFDRVLANFIDSFIVALPVALLLTIGGPNSALAELGGFLCNVAYYAHFTASRWQSTPGQRMMKMHLVLLDGKPIGQRLAIERFIAFTMPVLPLYLSIAPKEVLATATIWLALAWYIPILTRPDRRGVHDVLCNTIMVTGRV